MSRRPRTSREPENRLAALEAEHAERDDRIWVIRIGGDSDKPTGLLSPEEYEQHYGERPESAFGFNINMYGDEGDS